MKHSTVKILHKKIDTVEEGLKDKERRKLSQREREKIKKRSPCHDRQKDCLARERCVFKDRFPSGRECPTDFFHIIYKLSVLDRMRRYLDRYKELPRSFKQMLDHPDSDWGEAIEKRKSNFYKSPEKIAQQRGL